MKEEENFKLNINKICVIFIFLHICISVGLLPINPASAEGQEDSTIQIACNVPLTGALATYGVAIRQGVELALSDDKVHGGVPVHFNWEDNQSEAKYAVTAAQKQLMADPEIYISGVKPQYMAIQNLIAQTKIPHFVWAFDTVLRPKGEHNFRTWVNFKVEPQLFINYAKLQGAKRVAIVYVQLPHTEEEYVDHIIPGLKESGISELHVEPYQMDLNDFRGLAARVKNFSPDLLILSGFHDNLLALVPAFYQLGLIQGANTVFSYDLLDASSLLPPKMLEGVRVSTPRFLLNTNDQHIESWKSRFREKFGQNPLYTHAYAYDMTNILLKAARQLQRHSSAKEWMNALDGIHLQGITGPLTFDEQGDLLPQIELAHIHQGVVTR